MKQFEAALSEFEKIDGAYLVAGRCIGDESIFVGDFLNDLDVGRIEAYGHDVTELPPGMTARLTLGHAHRVADSFYVVLTEYRYRA